MKRHLLMMFLLFVALAGFAPAVGIIDEGFFVDGLDGTLKRESGVDVWSFICDTDITMSKKKAIPARRPIQILPCSVLEQMTKLAGDQQEMRIRLWALFTEYKRMNYLYAVYFLPLLEDGSVQPRDPKQNETAKQDDEQTKEADDEESIIPEDILSQIRDKETPDLQKLQQIAAVTGDVNLIGRTGYLEQKQRVHYFRMDAFGMNKGRRNLMLLPNEMLEDVHKQIARSPGRQRYTVSGLVTTYKGKTYMLVRRAARTYTQGNFTQ